MLKNRADERVEAAVVQMAFGQPAFGQLRTSNELKKRGMLVSSGGVRCIWLRRDLKTFDKRLKALSAKVAREGLILTEDKLQALKRAKQEKAAHGEIQTEHPGYLGAQDTFYIGTFKGVGRIYQQTFIDNTRVAVCKLYDRKHALCAANTLNDRVLPSFEAEGVPLLRVLTDRGGEYCSNLGQHEYELYLALENIDHSKTKVKSPQTNGICERFHKTASNEFYRIVFRKKLYASLDELQADLDSWPRYYNEERPHSGRYCFGRTLMQTWRDAKPLVEEKMLGRQHQPVVVHYDDQPAVA